MPSPEELSSPLEQQIPTALLSGPRQEGFIPRPDGGGTVHFVDADGAKIVQNVAAPRAVNRPQSAQAFYDQKDADQKRIDSLKLVDGRWVEQPDANTEQTTQAKGKRLGSLFSRLRNRS